MARKAEPSLAVNATPSEQTILEAIVAGGFGQPRHLALLSDCTSVQTLSPDRLPEVIDALDLLRHLLHCTTTAAFGPQEAEILNRTRAHFLLVGLVEELEALVAGVPSPALQPIKQDEGAGSGGKVKEGHPAHLRLKDECVAAVEALNILTSQTKTSARERVSAVVQRHFNINPHNNFGVKAIEGHATTMRKRDQLKNAVRVMLYNAFPEVYDDDRPPISRADWIKQCLSGVQIEAAILARIADTAKKAQEINALAKELSRD